jgi:glutamyl-Q tRNA(Asp) synthetase
VRIEDLDRPRCQVGCDRVILEQLQRCGLRPDEPPTWQSGRQPHYDRALQQLIDQGDAYACSCTRQQIDLALAASGQQRPRHGDRVYPGTCRHGLHGRAPRAWRLLLGASARPTRVDWIDRRLGPQTQDVAQAVGDFVLHRADGMTAYQLAVVVDDAAQGITDVVRGEDLADNTPRQILLQQALGVPRPRYLHTPLVLAADGDKLSKQNGAEAVDLTDPLRALRDAAAVLELPALPQTRLTDWLAAATAAWPWR